MNIKKIIRFFVAAAALAFIFAGCAANNNADGDISLDDQNNPSGCYAAPDITGEILDITNDKNIRVLVESEGEGINGQIWVSINEDTTFVDSKGEAFSPEDTYSLFTVGETASFLSDGVIMESYPMQTSASCVFID